MRCKWPSTGLQFPLQCLQVESAVTPRERGGRSENAAALCISVEVRGRGNGCGSEWTRVVSAAVAARSSGHGDPARMLRKGRRTGARPAAQRRAGPGVGGKDGASRKAGRGAPASVRLHPAGTPLCRSILSTLVYHSATTPPLFIFTAPSPDPPCAPARPPQPAPFIHTPVPSPPHHGPPAAATASGSAAPRSPPVPADWRGGAPGQPASAAQPRPFSRGRGVAQTRPPALDVLLANALVRPAVFHAPQLSVGGDSGASLVSTQPPPPWPAGAGAEPGAAGQRPGRNTLSPASSSHRG